MGLRLYLVKRLLVAVVLFVTVLIFNFFLFRLPIFVLGMDPMSLYTTPDMEAETVARLREIYGIPSRDAGFWAWFDHFILYVKNMLTLEFGQSFVSFNPVINDIMSRMPNTIMLMGVSTVLMIVVGVITGIIAASRYGSKIDTGLITIGLSLYSFPIFFIGMLLLLVFGFYIPLFPIGHSISWPLPPDPISYAIDYGWHMFLPTVTLTLGFFGGYMLLMRNTLVEVLVEDYILTARAKGLQERTVIFKHGLRNAFLPLITVIAISFAFIVSGAVLTETVFAWFGMGRLLYQSLLSYDWPVSQAIFWMIAVSVISANIIADLLYGVLDPRIKYG
ncbi:MAG: ABC transporter permease [Candidatus Heimdallarchaeota archaeon]|nr:MAG: ABC transporter permease [Candidatus Heimdallarchaeota archaeon]